MANNFTNFIKKNAYYLLIGFSLILVAIVMAIALMNNDNNVEQTAKIDPSKESPKIEEPIDEPSSDDPGKEPEPTTHEDEPTDERIIFDMPVRNCTVIKDFTSSTVVFNQTLGVYTGHMGIDFAADEGEQVYCAYDGTIESITSSYLTGTTIVVNHGNGLKSIYNSIEALETLSEGNSVVKGQLLGTVSDNNRQEYKDGAHLHFEVSENDVKVDPTAYLMLDEK